MWIPRRPVAFFNHLPRLPPAARGHCTCGVACTRARYPQPTGGRRLVNRVWDHHYELTFGLVGWGGGLTRRGGAQSVLLSTLHFELLGSPPPPVPARSSRARVPGTCELPWRTSWRNVVGWWRGLLMLAMRSAPALSRPHFAWRFTKCGAPCPRHITLSGAARADERCLRMPAAH